MKLIIAGSRSLWIATDMLHLIIKHFGLRPEEIVSGGAMGIDGAGERWHELQQRTNPTHPNVSLKRFIPDWSEFGKAAGPIRNRKMAEYADALLLIWDGKSKGSANMKSEMKKLKKPIYEVVLK